MWNLIIWIAAQIAYNLLTPKPKVSAPDPGGVSDLDFPSVGAGRPLPLGWGTFEQKGGIVTWYGDFGVRAVSAREAGIGTDTTTVAYRYKLGLEMVLCSGVIDDLVAIRFNDIEASPQWVSETDELVSFHFDLPDFYGGKKKGGGIEGVVTVYKGTATQNPSPYVEAVLGESVPAYRGVCYAVFYQSTGEGFEFGQSLPIPSISFVLRRTPNPLGLTGGEENIGGDANPANMIYDLITSPPSNNGLGISAGMIDLTALREMGHTLAVEGMGLTMLQDQATSAHDLLIEILRHIDAVPYIEPLTGLLVIKLIRFDYDPDDLPVLDETNFTLTSFSRPAWSETRNTIRVSYVDRSENFQERLVQAQDLASIAIQGGEVSIAQLSYRGFSNATSAQKAVARGLASLAYPMGVVSGEADRVAWNFRQGTVFKLNWTPLGISGLICRVARIGTGRLGASKIAIEAAQDIFGVSWTAYTPPPLSAWGDPIGDVPALLDQIAFPAPWPYVQGLSPGPDVTPRVIVAASPGAGVTLGFRTYVEMLDHTYGESDDQTIFTPSGLLAASIVETDDEIEILNGYDTDLIQAVTDADCGAGRNVLWLSGPGGEEFIAFRDLIRNPTSITLMDCIRGCIDTKAIPHSAGVRAWFLSYGSALVNVNPGVTGVKFQAYNQRGEIALASAPEEDVTSTDPNRAELPYLPTAVKWNGYVFPPTISGELTLSWSHRNRLGSWSYASAGVTADLEAGSTYTLKIYGETGTLIHTETGLTGTSFLYTAVQEMIDNGLGRLSTHLRVTIRTVASGGRSSFVEYDWEVDRV
jgi:hypothetical protein